MKKVVAVWKPVGWTPLKIAREYKKQYQEYSDETISYAGRLDPMAEGVVLLLVGEENKKRKIYEKLEKKYEAEIVWGISTDTYDALGVVVGKRFEDISDAQIKDGLQLFMGKQDQKFPPYSSKPFRGRPLFWWARNNRLSEVIIPSHQIYISNIQLIRTFKIAVYELTKMIFRRIEIVDGDFRQNDIVGKWQDFEENYSRRQVCISRISISCSSGTYIRQLVKDLGSALGRESMVLTIVRLSVGDFTKNECVQLS